MRVHEFRVAPNLPPALAPLWDLAKNVWFSWHWEAVRLFIRLDPALWERCYQNPVLLLSLLPQETLDEAARTPAYVEEVRRVHARLVEDLSPKGWFAGAHPDAGGLHVAYFSMEFGLSECFPIYGGGLGILAGDHLKSASDIGLPLAGVGLLYGKGYFRQILNLDGWQAEAYPENDWYRMPVEEVVLDGRPLVIPIEVGPDRADVKVWVAHVGRTPLYLLDTNVPSNPPHIRSITGALYGGDREMRIRQEVVLGIGGVRALEAVGLAPTVYHMNEGHSAFLALERIRRVMERDGLSFEAAREVVQASNVFTTHTPVPAGNEQFDPNLVRKYLGGLADRLGLSWPEFLALAQEEPGRSPTFNMTVLALRLSAFSNGVADLHAETSRRMWRSLWPGLPLAHVPITNISNGIHPASWLSHDLIDLFREKAGGAPLENADDPAAWAAVDRIPDADLWRLRDVRRDKLVWFARKRLRRQLEARGADVTILRAAGGVLDPKALTIGFARRFAAYKRAGLLFRDPDRLARILNDPARPAQVLIAGKAHPDDQAGKEIVRRIIHYEDDPRFQGRLVFLEDYDINVARYLVQGCDLWVNTPIRPLEASGTSGMKAVANGGLHLSTLDGWWADAYDAACGWAIGGTTYRSDEERDYVEAEALYNILEKEVAPIFYDRDAEGIPRRWLEIVRASMKRYGPFYNTHRMVKEYAARAYLPAHAAHRRLASEGGRRACDLAAWRTRVARAWPEVSITARAEGDGTVRRSGEAVEVIADVRLGGLAADEIAVEVVHGPLAASGEIEAGAALPMERVAPASEAPGDGVARFRAVVPCRASGRHGWAVRALPRHPDVANPLTPLLVTWES